MEISEKMEMFVQFIRADDAEGVEDLFASGDKDEYLVLMNSPFEFSSVLKQARECIPVPHSLLRDRLDIRTPWCLCGVFHAKKVAKVLLQKEVNVTACDHGGLNILHVLASVAYVSPDLLPDMIAFYHWLKENLDCKDLKTLLHMYSDQACNPLELSIYLGVFRLATEIFNTEGIYATTRHIGMYEYKAYDITEYEFDQTRPFSIFPMTNMMDINDIGRPETKDFLESEPIASWIKTKKRFLAPFVFLWFVIRLLYIFTLINLTEITLLEPTTNSTKCPSFYSIPKDFQFIAKVTISCVLGLMCVVFLMYDFLTISAFIYKFKFNQLFGTPTKNKVPSLYPVISRILQSMIALLSIVFASLTLMGTSTEESSQLLLLFITFILFWQILYFVQVVPILGYCILTLYHMAADITIILIIISVFSCLQAYVMRVIANPCPEEFRSFWYTLYEAGFRIVMNPRINFSTLHLSVTLVWQYIYCILGVILIMNFTIAVFSNTVSRTFNMRTAMMNLQQMYIMNQVSYNACLFLRSYYWKRHQRYFNYVNGKVYITSETIIKRPPEG